MYIIWKNELPPKKLIMWAMNYFVIQMIKLNVNDAFVINNFNESIPIE